MADVRRALLIAVAAHDNAHLRTIAAPAADVGALAEALASRAGGAFDVDVQIDERSYAMRHRIESFLMGLRPDDMAVLHIVGTGLLNDRGDLYFAGTDTRPEFLASSALEAAFVDRCVRRSRARRALVVLDCRYGNVYARGRVPDTPAPIDVAQWFGQDGLVAGSGRAFITTAGEPAFTFEERELLDLRAEPPPRLAPLLAAGMRSGQIDRDGHGRVTPTEVHAYLAEHAGGPPPHIWAHGPQDGMVLAPAGGSDAAVRGDRDVSTAPPAQAPPAQAAPAQATPPRPPAGPQPAPWPATPERTSTTPAPNVAQPTAAARPRRPAPPARRAPGRRRTRRPQGAQHSGLAARWSSVPTSNEKFVYAGVVIALLLLLAALGNLAGNRPTSDDDETEGIRTGTTPSVTGARITTNMCEPDSLVPGEAYVSCGDQVVSTLFSPLVDVDPETSDAVWGPDAPHAAAEDVHSADQQTWIITLKAGRLFHDGTPVTARSYVDAWNHRAAEVNGFGLGYQFDPVDGFTQMRCDDAGCATPPATERLAGLTAVDDRTIEVRLTRPLSQFPLALSGPAFTALPRAYFDDPASYAREPVGDGPFRMASEWRPTDAVEVTRFDDYPGPPARIEAIAFYPQDDPQAASLSFGSGELDILVGAPEGEPTAAGSGTLVDTPLSILEYLGFPLWDERFADARLRRAISMAIDREAIVDQLQAHLTPADAFVPPGVAGYRPGACGRRCSFNPDRARHLFEQAGGLDGPLTLWFNSGAGHEQRMEIIAQQLRDTLGVTVELQASDFADHLASIEEQEVDGPYRLGWIPDHPSAQSLLEPLLHSGVSSNYSRWSNAAFDRHIERGDAAPSVTDGLEQYARAEDIAVDEMPIVPTFFHTSAVVHSARLDNVTVGGDGIVQWSEITADP